MGDALIERLREGAADLHPYSMGEVDSPALNVALPAYLNEAAARIAELTRERDEAVGLLSEIAPAIDAYLMSGDMAAKSLKKRVWKPSRDRLSAFLSRHKEGS